MCQRKSEPVIAVGICVCIYQHRSTTLYLLKVFIFVYVQFHAALGAHTNMTKQTQTHSQNHSINKIDGILHIWSRMKSIDTHTQRQLQMQ